MCFVNTLHGCIGGLPQIKHQNPNMAYSLHFWRYMTTPSSNYTQYLFFLKNYLPYCITCLGKIYCYVLEIFYMVVLLVYHKSTIKNQIWHILFISWDIWLQHHQIIPNIYFSRKLFTLLYHLPKKHTLLCFERILNGYIVGSP